MYLPSKDSAPSRTIVPALPDPAEGLPTVLLVEDEPAVRRVIREMLERARFRVIEAVSGPLSAILGSPREVDAALRPEVRFVHAVKPGAALASFDEALGWFNFGALELAEDGALTVRILDAAGETLYAERFPTGG